MNRVPDGVPDLFTAFESIHGPQDWDDAQGPTDADLAIDPDPGARYYEEN